jgi:4-hydroxy-3-methylbut-2-enyl diphosphate reductase
MEPSTQVLVCAPLAVEALALGKSAHVRVVTTGMGASRSRASASRLAGEPARAVVVAGFGGALDPSLEPGDVVVADAVTGPDGRSSCVSASLADFLRSEGLRVVVGTIASRDHIVRGDERRVLFDEGACAVDMESAWLAAAARTRPFSVVRAVVDTPGHELSRVLTTLRGGARGFKSLARVGRALARFASEASLVKETTSWASRSHSSSS